VAPSGASSDYEDPAERECVAPVALGELGPQCLPQLGTEVVSLLIAVEERGGDDAGWAPGIPRVGGAKVPLLTEDDLTELLGTDAARRLVVARTLARYGEGHRSYHGTAHVLAVTSRCLVLCSAMPSVDRDAVLWAALFHDAIYDPRSSTNEAESAALAVEELRSVGAAPSLVGEVARLILLTAGHSVAEGDHNGAVLIDSDLASLGGTPEDYARYVDGVRREYSFVPDDAWRVGRARVLANLLALPRLFSTESMKPREAIARANMRAELLSLVDETQ
jgi:predicted metal-dependent HD superfamily phosphohydrolase